MNVIMEIKSKTYKLVTELFISLPKTVMPANEIRSNTNEITRFFCFILFKFLLHLLIAPLAHMPLLHHGAEFGQFLLAFVAYGFNGHA